MTWYRRIVRGLFALIFIGGGISHLVLGRVSPEGYAAFADTAALPWLGDLWHGFVMPNVGWLTVVLAVFEVACGVGILVERTLVPAVWGMLAFLVFITVLGYAFPTETWGEDLLKNRLPTIVMAALLVPLLASRSRPPAPAPDLLPVVPGDLGVDEAGVDDVVSGA